MEAKMQELAVAEEAQHVEIDLLPLERAIVENIGLDLFRPRRLQELNDGGERGRVDVLDLLEVQLERRLPRHRLVENVQEEGVERGGRLARVATSHPHQLQRSGAAGIDDFDLQITGTKRIHETRNDSFRV